MARNYYAEINLHLTWHTKGSLPLLEPKIETIVHQFLRSKCIDTPGVFIHEIGGIETHIHLCISIAPTILVSDFVGKLKGASSHDINQKLSQKSLEWQAGYGVVSFGTRDLDWVKTYVRNQRNRHARGKIEDRLERIVTIEPATNS
ncbi:MAG: IS200/IS605 family transposase [Gemmataceae bacterium]|nr:IS200/IS605 family transposase [Gemmataceae bacterium]